MLMVICFKSEWLHDRKFVDGGEDGGVCKLELGQWCRLTQGKAHLGE
jgi:hypothetical protein